MNIRSISINVIITAILIVGYHFIIKNKSTSLAYVDSGKLMSGYKGMSDVKLAIESKTKVLQSNVDTIAMELQNEIKKYEKERGKMTERERQTTEELMSHKQQQYMQFKQAMQNKAAEEQQKITNEALAKVNSIISDYGKSHDYKIVFGTTSGNIIYASEAINITDEVLDILNKQYEKDLH